MAMSFSPGFAWDGLAYAVDDGRFWGGVVKTMDWGKTWTGVRGYIEPNRPRVGVAFSPQFVTDRTAFSDIWGDPPLSMYKSTDGGVTWFKVNDHRVDGPQAFSPVYARDQTFIVGQDEDLALTQDGGRTLTTIWNKESGYARAWGVRRLDPSIEPPAPSLGAYRCYLPLMISGPPRLEFWLVAQEGASSDCYLYRSRDDGASWQEIAVP